MKPKLKPFIWEKIKFESLDCYECRLPLICLIVRQVYGSTKYVWYHFHEDSAQEFPTLEDAKSAAENWYTSQIYKSIEGC